MNTYPLKRIRLQHAHNLRDLGGIVGKSHQVIRWGKLFRSDSLSLLQADEWAQLVHLGVRTVVDLRSQAELSSQPDTPPSAITQIHCPLLAEQMDVKTLSEAAIEAFAQSMAQGYARMITSHPELVVQALKAVIAGLEQGAVIFHCSAGKDRTGILAAILLTLLGAPGEDIIADYEVSYTYNRPGINHIAQKMPQFEQIEPLLRSDAVNMEVLLNDFEQMNLRDYLLKQGVTLQELNQLDCVMLERFVEHPGGSVG